MSLIETAAKVLLSKLGGAGEGVDSNNVVDGLLELLPSNGGDLDLQGLASQFLNNGGLAQLASSWLGDGDKHESVG